jgi:hypothetical protein
MIALSRSLARAVSYRAKTNAQERRQARAGTMAVHDLDGRESRLERATYSEKKRRLLR